MTASPRVLQDLELKDSGDTIIYLLDKIEHVVVYNDRVTNIAPEAANELGHRAKALRRSTVPTRIKHHHGCSKRTGAAGS